MSLTLLSKKIDFESGGENIVLLNEDMAIEHGINPGDHIILATEGHELVALVNTTSDHEVKKHQIGFYQEITKKYNIKNDKQILVTLLSRPLSTEYIKKKIKRHTLNYDELKVILKDIVSNRLGIVEKTYFLSTIYNPGYNDEELYALTKAMVDTGSTLSFPGIVADKHSIGGVAGKGITPLVVAIVASYGITIPNTSTRSITTPAGTTDILETITNVQFTPEQIKSIIAKTHACMVWGGGLDLAPADDELIKVERPIDIESFDKFITSIIAKKAAVGINKLLIDVPVGKEYKIYNPEDVQAMKEKFISLGKRFGIDVVVSDRHPNGIDGNGVGPILEMREVLYIFENHLHKSIELENEALRLAGMLLELSGVAGDQMGLSMAKDALYNGSAYNTFKNILMAQGAEDIPIADSLNPSTKAMTFSAVVMGSILSIHNKRVIELARILGCPLDKAAGIYFYKKPGDMTGIKEKMFTIYASSDDRLNLGLAYIQKHNLFEIDAG